MSTEATSIVPGWVTTSHAFCTAIDPSASVPARSGIWPAMMLTETPVRNPIITEKLTKRVNRPRRSRPAAIITAPAISVSRNSAAGRSSGLKFSTADPAASAAALVVVMTMSLVLAVRPPATGPAKLAYKPWIGLTPARTLAAMPSGTLPMAPGRPATASVFIVRRSGATDRSHLRNPGVVSGLITVRSNPDRKRVASFRSGEIAGHPDHGYRQRLDSTGADTHVCRHRLSPPSSVAQARHVSD